jgi:predicted AAA+ superfamily ATPase
MLFFDRDVEIDLKKWSDSKIRKPLILRGARQVGKTSLLKHFGQSNFENTAYFNFDEQPELSQFFEQSKDVNKILQQLSLVFGKTINPKNTLIIFDEIQECKNALNTLKYFAENAPEYKIACAGSLLGITLGNHSSFPVGKVNFINIKPLTFLEFIKKQDFDLFNYTNTIESIENIPDLFYHKLVDVFKMYFISGGMPEPARILVEEKNIKATQQSLRDILLAYELDFSKHAQSKDIAKINYVWKAIPSQLARENKKFLYQTVKTGARAREYEDALEWLIQAGLVHKIIKCNKPNIPISAYDDLSAFKLYLLDVGLLRQQSQLDPLAFKEGNRLFTEFKGALIENYILQSLIAQFENLPRYWTSDGRAEVDFLIQYQNKIIPIEVKSDENIKSKSLTIYHQQFKPELRIRYSLKNLHFENGLLNIPLFMADFTSKLIGLL